MRDSTGLWVLSRAEMHFPSMNRYMFGSLYAQPDVAPVNTDDFDLDVVTDHYTLFFVA